MSTEVPPGAFPEKGCNSRSTTLAMTVAILPACVAAVGVAVSVVTFAVTVESELFAVDTVVAVVVGVATGVFNAAFHGFFTTTSVVVSESLDVSTVEDAVVLGFTRGSLNAGRSFLVRGVASVSVVSSALGVESSGSEAVDPGLGQEEVGLWAPKIPANGPVRVGFDGLEAVDDEVVLESDSAVWVAEDEPAGVFADPVLGAPSVPALGEDEPSDAGAAEATPAPVKTATPTPKAAAKAPIRPI